ncbi:MAG: DUF58 domain-containing protein [Chthonomonadales bacterium]|nr:DUF58 domain-containing protein [Chthonomonadales bacterium]
MASMADPRTLARIASLELRARVVVEGVISGLHRSPHHGYSVEFAQHRNYTPGDEIRHIDWKVYGRSDRYHVKQFEEETNLRAHIALDTSSSMLYGSGAMTKLQYASTIAAALAYLFMKQRDAVGLTTFSDGVTAYLPPSGTPAHAREMMARLETVETRPRTDISKTLHDLAERVQRRSLIVLLSDFFDDAERVVRGLQHFRHRRHEVIVFHTMDPDEMTFPFRDQTIFEGLENEGRLDADPRALRAQYVQAVEAHIAAIRRGCRDLRMDYVLMQTDTPLDDALARYLSERMRQP